MLRGMASFIFKTLTTYLNSSKNNQMAIYTDDTIIDFGIHKGKPLSEVPDQYLLELYQTGKAFGDLKAYIIDNLEAIRANIERTASISENASNEDDE